MQFEQVVIIPRETLELWAPIIATYGGNPETLSMALGAAMQGTVRSYPERYPELGGDSGYAHPILSAESLGIAVDGGELWRIRAIDGKDGTPAAERHE